MRVTAVLLTLAIAAGCAAPGAGDGGGRSGTVDEAKQTLLTARLVDVRSGGTFTLVDVSRL